MKNLGHNFIRITKPLLTFIVIVFLAWLVAAFITTSVTDRGDHCEAACTKAGLSEGVSLMDLTLQWTGCHCSTETTKRLTLPEMDLLLKEETK